MKKITLLFGFIFIESHIMGFIPRSLLRIKKVFRIDTPSAFSWVVYFSCFEDGG